MSSKTKTTKLKYNIVGKKKSSIVDLIILFNSLKKESVFVADRYFDKNDCSVIYNAQLTQTGELVGAISTKYTNDNTVKNIVSLYALQGETLKTIGVGDCDIHASSIVVNAICVDDNYLDNGVGGVIYKLLLSGSQDKSIKYVNSTKLNTKLNREFNLDNAINILQTCIVERYCKDCSIADLATYQSLGINHLLFGSAYGAREIKQFIDLIEDRVEYYASKSVNTDNGFRPYYMLARGKDNGLFAIVVTYKLFRGKPSKDSFLKDNYISDPFDYNSARVSLEKGEILQLATEFQAYIYELNYLKPVGHIVCLPYTKDKKCAYIDNNYVNHNYQCNGISTALVDATLSYLKENGYESYVLDVTKYDPINCPRPKKDQITPAIKQWLKKGATYDDNRKKYETFFTKPFKGSLEGEMDSDVIIATSEKN